jgi:selenocysteine-specific elongation factor
MPQELSELQRAALDIVGDDPQGVPTNRICRKLGKSPQELGDVFESLVDQRKLRGFAGLWFSPNGFYEGSERFIATLKELHAESPSQTGIAREKVAHRAGLTWAGKNLDRILALLAEQGLLTVSGTQVRASAFQPQLPARQRQFLDRILAVVAQAEVNVPSPPEIARAVVAPAQAVVEILQVGVRSGELLQASEQIFFTPSQVEKMETKLKSVLGRRPFAASEAKEALGTSRKYIIPILELLDSRGFTERREDDRIIRK